MEEQNNDVLDSTMRRERRKKIIEDLKKKEPSKSIFIKIIKSIFYLLCLGMFLFGFRTLLAILDIFPYEDNYKTLSNNKDTKNKEMNVSTSHSINDSKHNDKTQ